MKIEKIELQNVKSFIKTTEIIFKDNINIFVGPNAGGKSNLFEIIHALINSILFEFEIQILPKNQPTGMVTTKKTYTVQKQNNNGSHTSILEKFRGHEKSDQKIKMTLRISRQDVQNIQNIITFRDNLDKFIEDEFDHNNAGPQYFDYNTVKNLIYLKNDFSSLTDKLFCIEYSNGQVSINYSDDFEADDVDFFNVFKDIIRNYKVLETYVNIYNLNNAEIIDFSSNFLYIPPHRGTQNISYDEPIISLAQRGLESLFLSQKNVTQEAGSSSEFDKAKIKLFINDFYEKKVSNKELIELMEKFLKLKISIKSKKSLQVDYQLNINREGDKSIKLSSGEKEIFNFLCGVFFYNIKNGIILFDEPELHLHPQMQKKLLNIIEKVSIDSNVQFFIVTHSPSFINKDSIENVFRLYKNSNNGESKIFYPREKLKSENKDLVQIVNSLNNERVFFSDKVILVEGIDDRIIYGKILEIIKNEKENDEVIEILDIGGKKNFNRYKEFLLGWDVRVYIVGDRDSVTEFSSDKTIFAFTADCKKAISSFGNKGSKDAIYIKTLLNQLLNNEILPKQKEECEQKFLDTLINILERTSKISDTNLEKIIAEIDLLKNKHVYLLKEGEPEDYFDTAHFSIDSAAKKAQEMEGDHNLIPKEMRDIFTNIIID